MVGEPLPVCIHAAAAIETEHDGLAIGTGRVLDTDRPVVPFNGNRPRVALPNATSSAVDPVPLPFGFWSRQGQRVLSEFQPDSRSDSSFYSDCGLGLMPNALGAFA